MKYKITFPQPRAISDQPNNKARCSSGRIAQKVSVYLSFVHFFLVHLSSVDLFLVYLSSVDFVLMHLSQKVLVFLSQKCTSLFLCFPQKAGIANAFHLAPTRYWSNGFHSFIQPTPLPIQVFPFHHLLLERSELINICPHEKVLIGMYLPNI